MGLVRIKSRGGRGFRACMACAAWLYWCPEESQLDLTRNIHLMTRRGGGCRDANDYRLLKQGAGFGIVAV